MVSVYSAPMLVEYMVRRPGDFAMLNADRDEYHRDFASRLALEDGLRGRVLDIGCGPEIAEHLQEIGRPWTQLDGVDVDPSVLNHPHLTLRWHGPFETADIPDDTYDLAFAYYVVEHVARARPFFEKIAQKLKPGGVFWALTPNARSPFATAVRMLQFLRLKNVAADHTSGINHYPSYYRLNSPRQVTRAISGLGFSEARFIATPCVQWDIYFPPALRFLPHLFDRALGVRSGRFMLILAYRLQKAAV
jgi:SAM-dependent methyltransferase